MGRDALEIRLGNGVEFLGEPRCHFDSAAIGDSGTYCISHAHRTTFRGAFREGRSCALIPALRCASSRLRRGLAIDESSRIEMKNAGHVAGSTMFLVDGRRKVL